MTMLLLQLVVTVVLCRPCMDISCPVIRVLAIQGRHIFVHDVLHLLVVVVVIFSGNDRR